MARLGRWLFWIAGTLAIAYMGWNLLFSDHGYGVYREEAAKLREQERQLAELRRQREQLAREVLRLRNDPEALEELIHRELGYVHPDEVMVILPQQSSGRSSEQPTHRGR